MVILIPSTALEGNFVVHLEYDAEKECHYLVCHSDCCWSEYYDGPVKGEAFCECGKSTWRSGPGARTYIWEGQATHEDLVKWLDYWIIGDRNDVEIDIQWT